MDQHQMIEFTTLQVGGLFPTKIKLEAGQDMIGTLEMYFDDEGRTAQLFLIQAIDNITPAEASILDNEKIHTKTYYREGNMAFLFKYGKTPLLLETTLDASLYIKNGVVSDFDHVELSNLITVVRVNPKSNVINSLRVASMPKSLRSRILQAVSDAVTRPNFTSEYKHWIARLWSKYSPMQLWSVSEDTGSLGD